MPLFLVNNDLERLYGKPEEMPKDVRREYFRQKPLTIEVLEDCQSLYMFLRNNTFSTNNLCPYVNYRINGGEWITHTYGRVDFDLKKGDKVELKGTIRQSYVYSNNTEVFRIYSGGPNGSISVYGNVLSLFYDKGYKDTTRFKHNSYNFYNYICGSLFKNCYILEYANDLILPDNTEDNCYYCMFFGCSKLKKAPELPATDLRSGCYQYMFAGCTTLTSAPELPATRLANNCYKTMFNNCISLTTAPELPATVLYESCYEDMFLGCTSLTKAPELLAENLNRRCYFRMFGNCSNLNYVKAMFLSYNPDNCISYWLNGVAENGTFVKNIKGRYDITESVVPSTWTVIEDGKKPLLYLYFDDFYYGESSDDDPIPFSDYEEMTDAMNDAVDDPDIYGSNLVAYFGDTLEYDGVTYYVWEGFNNSFSDAWKLLTTTDDYNELLHQSIEYTGAENAEPTSLMYGFLSFDEMYHENDGSDDWFTNQYIVKVQK